MIKSLYLQMHDLERGIIVVVYFFKNRLHIEKIGILIYEQIQWRSTIGHSRG
jgi:hypothetical protein